MKGTTDFDFIQSQPINFGENELILGFDQHDQSEPILDASNQQIEKEPEPESYLKTPQSKKSRKSSLKNNPEDLGTPKINKMKQKKYKSMQPDRQKNPNQLFGHWSVQQNKRYHWFLEIYNSHFMNRSLRRMDRIFTSMAKFVSTREAQQCRSHHQKMQKKYKTFPKILLNLRTNHYSSSCLELLRDDMQKNEIQINQTLLNEQFLLQNVNTYLTSLTNFTQQGLDSSQMKQKQKQLNKIYNGSYKNFISSNSSASAKKIKRNNYYKQSKTKTIHNLDKQRKQVYQQDQSYLFEEEKISHYYHGPKNQPNDQIAHIENSLEMGQQVEQNQILDQNMMESIMIAPDMESSRNFFKLPPSYLNPDQMDPPGNNLFGEIDSYQQQFPGFF